MVMLHFLDRKSGVVSGRKGSLLVLRSYAEEIGDKEPTEFDTILIDGSPEIIGSHNREE